MANLPEHIGSCFEDLTGGRFGRLVVVGFAGRRAYRYAKGRSVHIIWQCACDCGGSSAVLAGALRTGRTKSCGCLLKEAAKDRSRTHGMSRGGHPLYRTWSGMIGRCHRPKVNGYENWGGRGISVCARWRVGEGGKTGFECFVDDVGARPPKHSLDRINNDGDYEPTNVRWADRSTQQRNTRRNKWVCLGGEALTLIEACERLGLDHRLIRPRLSRGLSFDRAVSLARGVSL